MLFEVKNKVISKYFDQFLTKESCSKKSTKKGPLFSKDDARIITSGKVYRQLFESEVQLINALQKVKYTTRQSLNISQNVAPISISKKHYLHSINDHIQEKTDTDMNKEVTILPENLLPSKSQSELILKMIETRKLKFNKQFEELQQSIGIINKDVNKEVDIICQEVYKEMAENKYNIDTNFLIFDMTVAKDLSWEQFKIAEIWITEHFHKQSDLIDKISKTLLNLEDTRVLKIFQQMSHYSTYLEKIGHLAPSEVHRIMNNILIGINDSILQNKEMYSDLRTKLVLSHIEENRKRQLILKNQILLWRQTISNFHLNEIKKDIEEEESMSLNSIKELLMNLDHIVLKLSSEIQEFFNDIMHNFIPEQYDLSYLNQTNARLLNVILQFDNHSDLLLNMAHAKVEEINQKYLTSMNNIKELLLQMHIFDNVVISTKTVEGFCWPILGSLHKTFEKYLNSLEITIGEIRDNLKSQSRKLYNYLSSLLNVWNEHKVSLNKAEESIYQKLNINRDSHRQQNLMTENDLNIIIDKMRQDSNEFMLKDSLVKCLNQLDKIKTSYSQYYNQQVTLVKRYPSLVEGEVKTFEAKLSTFFSTKREKEELQEAVETGKEFKEKDETFSPNFISLKILDKDLLNLEEKLENCYNRFIKQWYTTVATNALKIVSTKTEELDSELKLRFHLHEPRYRRIEYDIHNVRAAELVIHSERVSRQCKFIDNSLENIKQEYVKLDETQKLKQEDFKNQLLSIEMNYSNVTNQSKLINIKVMLEERNNQYMNNLRTSLRTFRQNIETNLQQLRQSNAEFVRSFKLFSTGGNFCPGEIDDFNKRIEKVNLKVEEMESEIMSNLEMVEKNHQDNLTLLKSDFEDKFKYHIVDINFMEIINRSMSNVQLKIKTEVSNSNSQSKFICEKIKLLDMNLKEILSKQYDGHNFINPSILKITLALFGCINDRSIYLDCIKTQGFLKEDIIVSDDKDGNNIKVQFLSLTTISKGGRQPNEDAGIKSVKSLLKSQKEFLIKKNLEFSNGSNASEIQRNEFDNVDLHGIQGGNLIENSGKNDRTHSASTVSEITTNRKGNAEKSKLVNKNQRLDKRYQAFGDDDLGEYSTFLKKIEFYCRDILNGILYSAELFYRNKGVRKVTQTFLQDNFDQAADDIIVKLKYYFKQAKDYRDECLMEFNNQLNDLKRVLCMFPTSVYRNVLEEIMLDCTNSINASNKMQSEIFQNLSIKKKCNYNNLRPDLSQTSKETYLKTILLLQESLYEEEMIQIENQFQTNRKIVFTTGKLFINVVSNVTEQLLLLMDNLLTSEDVENPEPKPRFVDSKELIRKQVTLPTVILEKNSTEMVSTKNTWTFNDMNDILQADTTFKAGDMDSASKCLITSKYTTCHVQCISDRESFKKKFKSFYFELLSEIDQTKQKMIEDTNNYKSFWDKSVKRLLDMNNI